MTKRRLNSMWFALAMAGAAGLAMLAGQPASAQTMRLPHCCAADSHFDLGAKKFAELLDKKTDGKMKVRVFPGGQLGQESEVIQNVQSGTIEFTLIGHDPLAQFAPITTVLSQPYLFRDHEHAFRLLAGPLGQQIDAALRERGLRALAWGDNGARVYTNNTRPLNVPADAAGLKIRSPQSPVNLAVTKAFGGIPIAMPYGEVYTALQQKTIDGQENAVINIFPARLYEVQKYMTMTDHLLSFTVLLVNEQSFSKWTDEQKNAVTSAAQEAMEFQRQTSKRMSAEQTAEMEKKGVQVNRPDLAKFRDAALPLHQEYVGKNFSRELYDLIRAN
ncbi:MAG TPA: TRAP transporter substrate-binding protein [Xanthobacteraceae bacterium]